MATCCQGCLRNRAAENTLGLTQHLLRESMSWKQLHLGAEGETVLLGGVNVWAASWKTQGEEPVVAKHPSHPEQEHRLSRYFIEADGKVHEFAAGEVSPGVWLFLVPSRNEEHSILLYSIAYLAGTAGCFILIRGFEHSLGYVALGAALVAIALCTARYAKSRGNVSEA